MQLDIGYIDVGKRYSLARLVRHISSQAMTQEESSKQKEQGIIPQVALLPTLIPGALSY